MVQSNLFKLLTLIALALLHSACQAGDVVPSPTLPPEKPTRTLPSTALPTETSLPIASHTTVPSDTPEPSPTSPLLTPTPDWSVFELRASLSTSPDGEWVARIIVAYPPTDSSGALSAEAYHALLAVQSASDPSLTWTVVDEWLNVGLGQTTPTVLRWTQDGESLFIADTGVPDGCGPSFYLNVRRVDLGSGQVTALDEELFGKLSVSPDGSALVEFSRGRGLAVHDLNSGRTRAIAFTQPEGDWWSEEIVWSPDGSQFLFVLSSNPCTSPEDVTSSIWRASLGGDEAAPLVLDEPHSLTLQSWPSDCLAQVNDIEGSVWWLNPCTGELNQTPPAEVASALDVLLGFFEALHQGDYAGAAGYYGGTYDNLQNNNPSIGPEDHAALLSNACQVNGYKCLPVRSYVLESWTDQDEMRFSVTFEQEGEVFDLGPCCGASIIDQPPVREFTYTLVKDAEGAYRVQELPVYVP